MHGPQPIRSAAFALALALLVITSPAVAEDFDESFTFDATTLRLSNLIGAIDVEGHDGADFQVDVRVRGEDASRDEITFEVEEGSTTTLRIVFPDERDFVYPELGSNSRTRFGLGEGGGWNIFGRDTIEVRGRGRGLEMWADVTIRVPRDAELVVRHGVGGIEALDVNAHLDLGVRSGHARAQRVNGDVELDTGSGHVAVEAITGALRVDTGSGHVEAVDVNGPRMLIDTGSGNVRLVDAQGDHIEIDTGSGKVEVSRATFGEITIDTGSGSVDCEELAADDLSIDTGSGSVSVDLVRLGDGEFHVDTGSGGIRFSMPASASAHVWAETGSGGVDLDVAGARIVKEKRDEIEFEVGDGAARIELETGSGGIRIAAR